MISERLKRVLARELGLDGFAFTDETTADRVPGWDSLKHIAVLAAVEAEFGIRFRSLEVIRLRNVGELQTLIERKCGS